MINAVRPGMATIPDAILLCASSPHARKGALWSAYAKHYAKDGDPILVWQAPTRDMNATVPQSYIDAHMEDDPARASAEYLAKFRSRSRSLRQPRGDRGLRRRLLRAVAGGGPVVLRLVDPAGGSGGAALRLAIAHREGNSVVVDLVRERRPPFMPSQVIDELIPLLKSLPDRQGGRRQVGWRLPAGGVPAGRHPLRAGQAGRSPTSTATRWRCSIPAASCCPRTTGCSISLSRLERHVARGGHDVIDHPRDQHDDLANAAMAVAVLAATFGGYTLELLRARSPPRTKTPTPRPPGRPAIKNIGTSLLRASSRSAAGSAGHDET